MKGVPEEEEEEDGEVWSSRTDPPPKIPCIVTRQGDKEPCLDIKDDENMEEQFWDQDVLEAIPEPPDGGYGWVIVAVSFLCNLVVDGIAYIFGIFLVHFVNYFHSQKGETAWIGSLLSGCYLSAGPVVSALTNRFGCRPVTIAGSLLSSAAFMLSIFAPNVRVLMFTYGIMGGIGFGLIYLPAIVSVGYYFSTKRAFATGIAVCGSGMGALVFAPITQYLIDLYDWKGALIILSGLALNCSVFGALMRPLTSNPKRKRKQSINEEKDETSVSKDKADSGLVLLCEDITKKGSLLNTEPGVQSTLNINEECAKTILLPNLAPHLKDELHNSVDVVPAIGLIVTTESSSQQLSTVTHLSRPSHHNLLKTENKEQNSSLGTLKPNASPNPPSRVIKSSVSQMNVKDFQRRFTMPAVLPASENVLCPTTQKNYMVQRCSVAPFNDVGRDVSWSVHGGVMRKRRLDRKDLSRPLYRKDIFYSGSIVNLPEYRHSKHDVRSYLASVTTIPCSEVIGENLDEKLDLADFDEDNSKCCKLPRSMMYTLQEALDLSLLKQMPFLLACIANVFGMIGYYIPFVYLTDSSVMKGIDRDRAAILISILGIANLIGRLVFGYIVDKPKVSALDVNNLCLCVSGIAVFTIPSCFSYTAIVSASIVFSFFISAYISLTSIILVDMVGLDKLTNSFGLLSLFRGAASIIGSPIAGSVYDATGTYDIPFYLAGGALIMSAILTFFVPLATRWQQKKLVQDMSASSNIAQQCKDYSTSSDTDSGRPESIAIAENASAV